MPQVGRMWDFREFPQSFSVPRTTKRRLRLREKKKTLSMKLFLLVAALVAVYCSVEAKHTPPKVQVYSRNPGEYGKENTFICHVSKFHPPDIKIELLEDGVEIPGARQTDLAFKEDWHFVLTRSVSFTPQKGKEFTCKVTHGSTVKTYSWEPNM